MSRPRACVLAVLVLVATAGAQAPGAGAAGGKAGYAFDWPVPARLAVTKDGEQRGQQAKLRFWLDVAPAAGGELRVRLVDFEFLRVGGRDATTPEARAALAPTLALTQAVPDIVVDRHGRYLRVDGLEAMFARLSAFLGEQKGVPAAQRERMLQMVREPSTQEALQEACGADWQTWVGAWVGFDVPPGQEVASAIEAPFLGAMLPAKATRRHLGDAQDHPGCVRLSMTTVVEGPEATKAFAAAMARVAQQTGGKPFPAEQLEAVRAETSMEVVTDPRTLRPLRASRTKTVRITMKGDAPREQVERSDCTFDWSAPAPAGR